MDGKGDADGVTSALSKEGDAHADEVVEEESEADEEDEDEDE